MVRIVGVDINDKKRVWQGLTQIYGIGQNNVWSVLEKTNIDGLKRVAELTDREVSHIQKKLETDCIIEGDLRREVQENIKRLKTISSYRGIRHTMNLPVRGQRTRSNARTKRGKRKTIGAMRKEMRTKVEKKTA